MALRASGTITAEGRGATLGGVAALALLACAALAPAAQQTINLGTAPNDRSGDTLRAGGTKINANFGELYTRVAALEAAPAGISSIAITLPGGFSVANSPLTVDGTIAVTTSLSGLIKVSGGNFLAAVAGTDYLAPAGGTSIVTLGTVTTGAWQATPIADGFIASAATWNAKQSALTFGTGLTNSGGTVTVNSSQNLSRLSNLTSNGFVKTTGADGTLSIDTASYLTGNQTITLSGDVSGSGTTAIAVTIGAGAVSNAKLANSAITIAGTSTSLGGTISRDAITGVSSNGYVKRTAANTYTHAAQIALGSEVSGTLPVANGGTGTAAPSLVAGANVTITGTWPNQTIAASGGGGASTWAVKTANYTAAAGDRLQADTSGGAFTITLPATPNVGDEVAIEDAAGSWGAFALTIGRNGQLINGLGADYTANVTDAKLSVVFVGGATGWSIK